MRWSALLLLAFAGCGSISPRPEIEEISYGFQAYDDLPVPQDFRFDDSDRSWAYRRYENTALNLRCGQFRYVGDRDVGQLVNWYNDQMRQHKWQQVSLDRRPDGREATMVFHKETDAAVVKIVREATPSEPKPYTVITLEIGVASAT